jgi:hypothetical protein
MTRLLVPPLSPPLSPRGLRRTRSARAVAWGAVVAFVWAAAGLPAAHAIQHVREATDDANADDVHVILRQVIRGRPPVQAHHHRHDEAPTEPSRRDPSHGRGSLQHFAVALLAKAPPRLAPPATTVANVEPSPAGAASAARDVRSPRCTRGPPALTAS